MASSTCITRLRKEYKELQRKPVENILACPKETNILEWHYVVKGPTGSPYEGGYYHGVVIFPSEYPFKPPSIQMYTPNGRFKTNTKLCLSMSDFHPETWNPMWSVGTILMGLYSFMQEETPTYGSIITTLAFKRSCAKESLAFNNTNKVFCELFPEYVELYKVEAARKNALESNLGGVGSASTSRANTVGSSGVPTVHLEGADQAAASWTAMIGVLAAIAACTWAILALAL